MKSLLRYGASFLLSAIFLYFAFRQVDLDASWQELRRVDLRYVAVYVVCLLVIQGCRIFRWDVLIRPFAQVSTAAQMRISCVGLMLIFALPLRLGEFARPYLLKRETGASLSAGIGAAAVERTIDGLLVTFLFFLMTQLLPEQYVVGPELEAGGYASLAIFGGATIVIAAALKSGEQMTRILHRLGDPISLRLTNRAVRMLQSFITGLRSLPDWRAVIKLIAYTLAYWAANGLGFYCVLRAFGWNVPASAGFFLVCVLVLGIMIPAGPGHLGPFQAALNVGLAVFNLDQSQAQAYGFVVYPLNAIVILAFGLPYLFSKKIGVASLLQASNAEAEDATP
jgi:hypothetical protein